MKACPRQGTRWWAGSPGLGARRERPRCCRAAEEQGHELLRFHTIELHSIPASQGRIIGYRIGEEQSGGSGTILPPVSRWRGWMSEVGPKCENVAMSKCFPVCPQ